MKPIFSITVGRKRDVLLAQLRTRQLVRMLGLAPLEQARIVCLVFEVACRQLCDGRRPFVLTYQIHNQQLQVLSAAVRSQPRLVLSLPVRSTNLAVEDVFWALDQIQHLSKPNLFDEIRQQNSDLLRVLGESEHVSASGRSVSIRAEAA
jgi:hypothetical protein